MNSPSLDSFPCLLIATNMETNELIFTNEYSNVFFGSHNENVNLFNIVSKATTIFFESYIRPTLIKSNVCNEIQITLLNNLKEKIPAVANISLINSTCYWSIYVATERDRLYQELILARENLEKQNDELLNLARTDPLTALLNRRAATEDFEKICRQLRRSFVPVSLLLIDIDFFKDINDNYGHDEGDKSLIELSKSLQEASRETDILARWGGEEFLIVIYNSDLTNTKNICQRLHQKAQRILLPSNKGLTVSIGLTELIKSEIEDPSVLDKVIKRADDALYLAKKKGKNRTVTST